MPQQVCLSLGGLLHRTHNPTPEQSSDLAWGEERGGEGRGGEGRREERRKGREGKK